MQHLVNTGLVAIASVRYVSSFGNMPVGVDHRRRPFSFSPLNAEMPSSSSQSTSPTSSNNSTPRVKKKNKYANFSKADNLILDPFDAIIKESRTKLMELHREDSKSRRRRKSASIEEASLEAIDRLLSSADNDMDEAQNSIEEEKRERNKRAFPDPQTIDPYDPTTYGYIELGTIVGAHGVHGLMKLASITDFSHHRLCQPGTRHIKLPNRRSPREIQLMEGRPLRPDAINDGTSNPIYLIRLENVDDREEALKMRGCVLFALEEERVDDLLKEDEYIVSDLVGLNVFLDETLEEHSGKGFEELFVGNIRGVVMGSEMCAIPGLGQDLLEVALPSPHGGQGGDLVLIPFVPQIVSSVSLDKRMISIVPPKGLLDLSYRREEKVRIKGLLPPAKDS